MFLLSLFILFIAGVVYELVYPEGIAELTRNGAMFAKMTPGAIVAEVRGKIAATVFARNKGGAVIRTRTMPVRRKNPPQSVQTQALAAFASSWRNLTESQRAGWNAASANFPKNDNLGQTILLSGEQLYVRSNANRLKIGQGAITDAPSPTSFVPIAFTSLTPDISEGEINLAFTPTVPAGFNLVVRATRPMSAGKSFVAQSEFKQVQVLAAAATSPQDIHAAYSAIFGGLTGKLGQKIFVEMFLVEIASGLQGQVVRGFGTVQA